MQAEEFFAAHWPPLVPELRAALAKAGTPPADRDDLVQETAVKLLGMWDRIDWDRPIAPLARRVALNAWRDQWRHRGTREVVGPVPEQPASSDTERHALARVEIREVARALNDLAPAAANVLRLAAVEAEGAPVPVTSAVSAAARMARTRARRALAATLKVASAVAAAVAFSGRLLGRSTRTSVASFGVLATMALVLAGGTGSSPHPTPLRLDRPIVAVGTPTEFAAARHPSTAARAARPTAVAPRAKHLKPASRSAPYYYVGPGGPAQVGVFVNLNVQGYGLRVQRPASGERVPVCTWGDTPTTSPVPRCED